MNGNIYALRVIVFDFERGQSEPGDNVFEEKSSFPIFKKMSHFVVSVWPTLDTTFLEPRQ